MIEERGFEYDDDDDIDCNILWNELAPTVDIHPDYQVDHTSDEYYTDVGLVPIEFDLGVTLPYRTVLFKDYQRPTKKAARKNVSAMELEDLETIYDPVRGLKNI